MKPANGTDFFAQIHIDVARNATDDFNLFHDANKWRKIKNNPFAGPIVLGFQLESLIENKIFQYRRTHHENSLLSEHHLRFSNYQFSFAGAVKPQQQITVQIRKTQFKTGVGAMLSNRVSLQAEKKLALIGFKKETQQALFPPSFDLSEFGDITKHKDRNFLPGSSVFLKRKFMNTSNAKNFLCGSNTDQSQYFDELEDKMNFPEIFPCALSSCALLEKAKKEKHDFEREPMVYISHKISVDRELLKQLKSNDILNILVKQIRPNLPRQGSKATPGALQSYQCLGVVKNNAVLFSALIDLSPLEAILNKGNNTKIAHSTNFS